LYHNKGNHEIHEKHFVFFVYFVVRKRIRS
jgi:hypothetical protein